MNGEVIAVFGSSSTTPGTAEWTSAFDAGARLGRAGLGVLTGGYGGSMEAVSQGAASVGAPVIGVTAPALFPGRTGANRYVTEVIEAETLAGRIDRMTQRARGAIVLPGSVGTATELLICWNINHIVRRNGGTVFPCAAVGHAWQRVADTLAREIDAVASDIHWSPDVSEAVGWIIHALETPGATNRA